MTATVRLAYGETGLELTIDPAVTTVVTPVHHPVTEPADVPLRAPRDDRPAEVTQATN